MSTYLKQGDPLWSRTKLGHGPQTIGKSGCLLCVYTEIARHFALDVVTAPTPLTLNKVALAQGAFIGSGLIQSKLAHALGLAIDDVITDLAAMRTELKTASDERVFIVHVDHGGSKAADHFILAVEFDHIQQSVLCADPATGAVVRLPISSITAPAGWGGKNYVIRSVRRVTKVQSSL